MSVLQLVRFLVKKAVPKGFTLITGLPDVGLVGVLASSHIVSSLKMEEIGTVESDMFPPVVVLHGGIPKSPIRVFAKRSIIVVLAEMAIPASMIQVLSESIVTWAQQKQARLILSIGGMAVQNRQDISEPKVFAATSRISLIKEIGDAAELLGEGYIVGAYALILKLASQKQVPAITLLTQSFYNYPDPEAAAAAVQAVNKLLKTKVDVSELIQRGEEIRLKAKDIMKRTQSEMAKMNKAQEYDVPALYG